MSYGNNPETNHALWAVPVLGGSPRRLGNVKSVFAAWSPDGSEVVFTRFTITQTPDKDIYNGNLYMINADGSGLRPLVRGAASTLDPSWQPMTTGP